MVCVVAIAACKAAGIITYRDFKMDEAKKCKEHYGFHTLITNRHRVPHFARFDCHDLLEYLGLAIPLDSGLYYFQEFDYHFNCVWGGAMVWWRRHINGSILFWLDGIQLTHRCVGRYQARARHPRHCKRRCCCSTGDFELWLPMDGCELLGYSIICAIYAKAHQAY